VDAGRELCGRQYSARMLDRMLTEERPS